MSTLSRMLRPQLYLGEALLRKPGHPVAELKCARTRLALRGALSDAPSRPALCLAALRWPMVAVIGTLLSVRRHGAIAESRSGKGPLRQLREILGLAIRHTCPPDDYFRYDLYLPENLARAGRYLHRFETKQGLFGYVNEQRGGDSASLLDKAAFERRCRDSGIPTVPIVLRSSCGVLQGACEFPAWSPNASWYVKPTAGKGGRGIERWDATPDGGYLESDGRVLDAPAFLAWLRQRASTQDLIVQPRVKDHPTLAGLGAPALSTVRVMSVVDEDGGFEIVNAVLRVSVDNATVDNFHGGGVAAPVELATGEVGAAIGMAADSVRTPVHPRSGARIEGLKLPDWDALKALVGRAHSAFPEFTVIGWDIAMAPTGPLVLEANHNPGIHLLQRPFEAPLGDSRLAELVAYHVRCAERETRGK